MDFNKA